MRSFRVKLQLLVAACLCIVVLLASISAALLYRQHLKTAVQKRLVSVAATAAAQINGDEHEDIFKHGDMKDPRYLRLVRTLHMILEHNDGIKFIYTLRPVDLSSPENAQYAFVLDGGTKGRALNLETSDFSRLGDFYNDLPAVARSVFVSGRPGVDEEPIVDSWGVTISGYAPIFNNSGKVVAVLGVDMTEKRFIASLMPVYMVAGISILLSLLIGLTVATIVGRWVLRPISALSEGARRIMDGVLDLPVPVHGNDDLADAMRTFNEMMIRVRENQEAIRRQAYIDSQIEIAATVQKHFLQWPTLETSAINVKVDVKPADSTGGDWAQFHEVKDKHVWMVVGDVMGHGVGSGMMAAAVAGAFEVLKPQLEHAPSVTWLLDRLGDVVHSAGKCEMLMTMVVARVDIKTGDLEIASAGHPHPRIVTLVPSDENPQTRKSRLVRARGNPLGYSREAFEIVRLKLFPGEALVLISDGVLERRDENGRNFGMFMLPRILERTAALNSNDLVTEIFSSCMSAGGDDALEDDVSILVAVIPPSKDQLLSQGYTSQEAFCCKTS